MFLVKKLMKLAMIVQEVKLCVLIILLSFLGLTLLASISFSFR